MAEKQQCTAMIRDHETGKKRRCKQWAKGGTTKCHNHGGATPRGIASPHYKHGRYCRGAPKGVLMDAYRAALADPNVLKLHDEIAVARARAFLLFDRANTNAGDTPDQWQQLADAVGAMEAAQRRGDPAALNAAMRQMRDLVLGEAADHAEWNELYRVLRLIGDLTARERQRQIAYQSMVSVERAMEVFQQLLGIVRRHVTDPKTLQKIAAEAYPLIYATADDAPIDAVWVPVAEGGRGETA